MAKMSDKKIDEIKIKHFEENFEWLLEEGWFERTKTEKLRVIAKLDYYFSQQAKNEAYDEAKNVIVREAIRLMHPSSNDLSDFENGVYNLKKSSVEAISKLKEEK